MNKRKNRAEARGFSWTKGGQLQTAVDTVTTRNVGSAELDCMATHVKHSDPPVEITAVLA
jgi:hypothetical protein